MSNPSPSQALATAIQSSLDLQQQLNGLSTLTNEEEDAEQLAAVEGLAAKRDEFIRQTFAHSWTEEEVQRYHADFEQLESLNTELTDQLELVKKKLFQQRVDNQQGRKAVNAYGSAKNQWQG